MPLKMPPSVSDTQEATSKSVEGETPREEGQPRELSNGHPRPACGTAKDGSPGCGTTTREGNITKEGNHGGTAAGCSTESPPNLDMNQATHSTHEKELLPNGIPKIVYDVHPAAETRSGDCAASDSFGVYLDAADSHLDLRIDKDIPLKASCMHTGGFQYMWKGVRSTHGVKGKGKYFFEVKVGPKPLSVVMPDTPANTQHVCRVGVSQPLTSLHLGDSGESWGFGGTGKKSTNRKFLDYGGPFGEGDVIGVVVDLDALTLAYTKNGKFLGVAFELPQRVRDTGIFPHIYVKNFDFRVNFKEQTKWFAPPGEKIKFIGDLKEHDLMVNPVEHPKSVSECEFIMMCGLPACGKTYWAERHMEKYAAKSYVLLGTNAVIDQMKVMGLKRQANYAARWEELMSTATEVFNSLVSYAGSGVVPRNIIIDQTNVFKRARCRKVQPFLAWGTRRCVVMVTDERTLQERTQKREREEGKIVPVSAVMDMKAAFALPSPDDGFNVIDYVELPESESRKEIRRINDEGRAFKSNNPGLSNRQPKPHIEARAASCEGDAYPAKRHKGGEWHPQQSWGSAVPQGARSGWSGQDEEQGSWGSSIPQRGWQQPHGIRDVSDGGNYSCNSGGGYGYGYRGSGQQVFDSSSRRQQYGQHQQRHGGGGYSGNQQSIGGSGGYYNSHGKGYYSRYPQDGGGQQWQQQHHRGEIPREHAGGARGPYGSPHWNNLYSGGYQPNQGRS